MSSLSILIRSLTLSFVISMFINCYFCQSYDVVSPKKSLNSNFTKTMDMALSLLNNSFSAGSGYSEVWIRDTATFIDVALEVNDPNNVIDQILPFLYIQSETGEIPDGYIKNSTLTKNNNSLDSYVYLQTNPYMNPWGWCNGTNDVCKNNVETDQESSLVQCFHSIVKKTTDVSLLKRDIKGLSLLRRLELALQWVLTYRSDTAHDFLIWGGTTIDWGDIQSEDNPGTQLSEISHRAIDIYDNALFITAIESYINLCRLINSTTGNWPFLLERHRRNVRNHLWDPNLKQFRPHIYLNGSPFPVSFNESNIYYHGGTAIAALAGGILSSPEVLEAYHRMQSNVQAVKSAGGDITIGLSNYPPYPDNSFMNPSVSRSYSYQNSGDWDWFGGRIVQMLIIHGYMEEAVLTLQTIVDRVILYGGFFEWFSFDNKPQGSAKFHGSAGAIGKAIRMLETKL